MSRAEDSQRTARTAQDGVAKAAGSLTKAPTGVAKAPAGVAKTPTGVAKTADGVSKQVEQPSPGQARARSAGASRSRGAKGSSGILDAKFLDEQKRSLLEERSSYVEQAQDLRAEADSLVEEMEPGDVQFDEESGEGGTVTVDRERDLALSAQALAAVEEIDEALSKIANGTYGLCENCGEQIPKSRLRALPYARMCIACKSGGLSRR